MSFLCIHVHVCVETYHIFEILIIVGNLREEVGKIISLKSLLSKHNEEFWRVAVYPKLKHILRSTLSGLVHLHNDHRVQHCDLKRK